MDQTLLAQNARRILAQVINLEVGGRVKVMARDMIAPANRGRQVLYRFKNEDPKFSNLQIRLDPDEPNNYLWLIRTDTGLIAPAKSEDFDEPSVVPFPSIEIKF